MEIDVLKKDYNKLIARYIKAEEVFKESTVEKCIEYIPLYIKLTIDISRCTLKIEKLLGRKLNNYEIWNGFKEIK